MCSSALTFLLPVTARPVNRQACKSGFSLVELSIVLVILGLLTGGILGGQSLIKAAELRSIGEEYKQWQIAVNTFKGKYNSLPGDTTLAVRIWGDGDATGETWDGNGDGTIDYAAAASQEGEIFTFWQHLSLAGLINGEYTGIAGGGSVEDSSPGENVPASKYGGGGWSMNNIPSGSDESAVGWYYNATQGPSYGNFYQVGAKTEDWEMGTGLLTPEEAWNIDTKFDDGIPSRGIIIGRYFDSCGQLASGGTGTASNLDAVYNLSESSEQCALAFLDEGL